MKLSTLFTVLLTLLVVGCKHIPEALPELPPKPDAGGLPNAEYQLDKATAERLSKLASSVGVAYFLAQKNLESSNNNVVISELRLAKALVGQAERKDWEDAKKRIEVALGGGDLTAIYAKEQTEAQALKSKLADADKKYEEAKTKAKAEYDAKLQEREQIIKREQEMRRLEADEARKDKFTYLGGLIMLAGVLWFIFGNKLQGIEAVVAGFAVSSIGFIWGSPYFPYAVGLMLLLVVVKVAILMFKKKAVVCDIPVVTNQQEDK